MNLTVNYKTKILFILITGLFLVSIITAISMYSTYQYKHAQLLSNSTKVVTLFEDTFKDILEDFQYFKSIDFSKDSKKIVTNFKKLALVTYNRNKNINALSLIKQFDTLDYKEIITDLSSLSMDRKLDIRPISKIIQNSRNSESTFSSVIIHSEPVAKTRKSVGIELASEENRHKTISKMHNTNSYAISAPVNLVHRYKKNITNSILFYPLYKNEHESFYKWYVAAPFTYKKILDNIIANSPTFNNLHIDIIDNNENSIVGTHGSHEDDIHDNMILILEQIVDVGNKQYTLKISTNSLWTFDTFGLNLVGFFSGIFFLSFIGFYLFSKEQKNIEISALKFRLSEAQKIASSGHCVWKKKNNNFSYSEGLISILELTKFTINIEKLFSMIYPEDKKNLNNLLTSLKTKTISENGNITFRMEIGIHLKWLKMEYRFFYDKYNNLEEVFIVVQDITSFKTLELALKLNNEKFKKIAITDHLTGAYNRVYFDKEIKNALGHYKRYGDIFSILLIDIDHFKKVNDNYGHNEGDNVLVQFSELIKSQLRDTDIFARWGGEEFVILISHIDKESAVLVANKIRLAIECFHFSNKYKITCSIGVTQVEKDDEETILFNRVDKALYCAKEDGRNKVKQD